MEQKEIRNKIGGLKKKFITGQEKKHSAKLLILNIHSIWNEFCHYWLDLIFYKKKIGDS